MADDDSSIPPRLLQRLLEEFREDKKTRISQAALNAVGEYLRIFVKEAILRAAEERKEGDNLQHGLGSLFLEVSRPEVGRSTGSSLG
jgi:hypothetical protein